MLVTSCRRSRIRSATVALVGAVLVSGSTVLPARAATDAGAAAAKARADFITRADEVCRAGKNAMRAELEAHEDRVGFAARSGGRYAKVKIASPASVTEYVKAVLPLIEAQVKQLQLIPAPTADRALIAQLLRDTRSAVDVARKDPRQVAYDDPFHDLGKRYRSYGFQQCGSSDRPWTTAG